MSHLIAACICTDLARGRLAKIGKADYRASDLAPIGFAFFFVGLMCVLGEVSIVPKKPERDDRAPKPQIIIARIAILATFVACGGCTGIQAPIVDMNGVDQARYNIDLSDCAKRASAMFISAGNPISRCMEERGYKILFRN
jgi:predicted metal-binding protein